MSTATPLSPLHRRAAVPSMVTVDIVVPVYNEARELDGRVRTLRGYLDARFPFAAKVTIVDNASTDGTWDVASRLAAQVPGVRAMRLEQKGRGGAVKAAWAASDAEVLAYMDVDLSTDLDAILPLVAPLLSGHSDLAIGTRLARGARVVRSPKREVVSRLYNLLIHLLLRNRFSDAQCGFKAVRADVGHALLPLVADRGWFFDTELLVLAAHNGLRIHEVPVDWVDDPDSRVDVVRTAIGDLRGLCRLSLSLLAGHGRTAALSRRSTSSGPRLPAVVGARFASVGGASTVAYLVLFLVLQLAMGWLAASAVALTVTACANAVSHWRFTLDAERGRSRLFWQASVTAWSAGLALTSLALTLTAALSGSLLAAVVAITAANGIVSVGRFLALRGALFRAHKASGLVRPR
jgi:putative flippase GtrA